MLKLRIRLMEDNGTKSSKSRVIKTESITVTHVLNEAPRLTFQASRADVGNVNTPFVVGVEYSTGGSFQPLPEHNLFIVEQDSDDSLDPAKVVTYECQGFVAWLLSGALHAWHRTAKDGRRTWLEPGRETASAGWVLNGMFTESKNGGWFPALQKDFNGTTDSAGKSWTNADRVEQAWELDKNIMQILEQMTLDGLCDWTSSGTTWRLFRADTYGTDKAELVLGGTGFESVPVKVDASSLYSHIRAIPEGIPWQNFTSDTTIRNRFGHRSVVLQQSGVKSASTSAKLAQPHIEAGKQVLREESYNWTPRIEPNGSRGICPWADFKLGDHVTARSRGGKLVRRVVGIIAEQSSGMTKVQVRVGEKIGSAGSRLARRLESVAVGGIVGGSGSAFPSTPAPVLSEPSRVDGLVLVSNEAEWLADGSAKSTVEISWAPVTDNVDGTEAAIESYEVWVRRPDTQLRYLTTTTDTSIVLESLVPGESILVAVRAMSDSRRYGEFSLELPITPVLPKSLVPTKVTGLTITGNVAEFSSAGPVATISFTWNPITKSIDGEDITVEEYEVYDGRSLLERVTTTSSSIVVPSGREVSLTVRGYHELGGWSDLSDPATATAATPAAVTAQPTAPILDTGMGNVVARWDGNYVQTPTMAVMNIRAEARVGTSGAWIRQGTTLDDAGTFNIRLGDAGDTVQVRFISFDKLLRDTGTSAISSITVQGVEFEDFDTASQNYFLGIESKADSAVKSTVVQFAKNTSATTPPTSGWSGTRPSRSEGEHIWTRTLITYNNGTTSTTTPFSSTGDQGPQGPQGVPGTPGESGATTYTWIRYADTASGGGISNNPTGKKYIGFAYNKPTATESNTPGDYKWSLIQGEQGVPGTPGADGQPMYTWVRYSANSNGSPIQTTPQATTKYVGIAVNKPTATPSNTPGDYTWSLFKGADGDDGSDGISVTSVVRYYRLGTSKPGQPSGASPSGWSTTEPGYEEGQNLYYADKVTYSDNTVSWSTVQLSSAYTASAQANSKADALAAGQVIIERTVNGLNRKFTSIESPGRGFLGYENLAPEIKGSGEWAEVDRNRITNPLVSQGVEGWSISSSANNLTYLPDGVRCDVTSSISAGNQVFQQSLPGGMGPIPVAPGDRVVGRVIVSVPADAPRAIPLRNRLTIRDSSGQTGTDWHSGAEVWIEPGESAELYVERVVGGTRDNVQASVLGSSSQPLDAGDSFIIHDGWTVQVNPIVEGLIAPGRPSPDPDMRVRRLGSGESVLEIERVAELPGVNDIAGVSTRNGKPAVRIIPTGSEPGVVMVTLPVTASSVTGMGTVSLDAPLQGTLDDQALSLIVLGGASATESAAPNQAGDHPLRVVHGDTTGGYVLIALTNGATRGNGDVWWSGIGLYEDDGPDDDAIPFNQGDEWHQLGWADPADEGIADRLTIIHTWVWNGQDWVHYDIWAENIFASDSVTARIVNMDEGFADKFWANEANFGRIGVDFLEPNIGDTIDIHGNVVITGLLDPDEGRIPAIENSVDQVAGEAAQAAADASIADGKALAAQTLASDLQENFGKHQQVFRVTDGVPEVGSIDGDNVLRIESDRITMIQGGDVVTYWDQGQLVVGTTIAAAMQLRDPQSGAGHIIEHDGSGGTTIKSI